MKLLVIRFSSIGDIVLTSPVIRCIKTQRSDIELHFITKERYREIIQQNPYIDKIFTIKSSLGEVIPQLKKEKYDYIIDLHNSIRSSLLKLRLGRKNHTFRKLNFKKWLFIRFRINLLPDIHLVDRYMETVKFLGIKNDGKALDYFLKEDETIPFTDLPETHREGYVGIVIGSIHQTKQLPIDKLISLCDKIQKPIILLGGSEDKEKGDMLVDVIGNRIYNACGKFTVNRSASLIKQADKIISNDTGLMHIAAAFNKFIVSVWGNTVPQFGMYPYMPDGMKDKSIIMEVKGLTCRPCSKLGFEKCPLNHFNCMNMIDESVIAEIVNN